MFLVFPVPIPLPCPLLGAAAREVMPGCNLRLRCCSLAYICSFPICQSFVFGDERCSVTERPLLPPLETAPHLWFATVQTQGFEKDFEAASWIWKFMALARFMIRPNISSLRLSTCCLNVIHFTWALPFSVFLNSSGVFYKHYLPAFICGYHCTWFIRDLQAWWKPNSLQWKLRG